MKILKRTDIEAIGNRVYTAYRKLPKIAEQRMICAVDPDILLTDLLGLRVDYKHLSIDRSIYGATSTRAARVLLCKEELPEDLYYLDGKTILIETDLQKDSLMAGKCRFTKCHEASHHIYKMLYPQFYGYNDDETDPVLHFSREPEIRTGIAAAVVAPPPAQSVNRVKPANSCWQYSPSLSISVSISESSNASSTKTTTFSSLPTSSIWSLVNRLPASFVSS